MKKLIGAGMAVLLFGASPAIADHGHRGAGVNERQQRIEQRIGQGVRSGELSPREFHRLQHELREIQRAEHHFRADGRFSRHEREELHARLDDLSRDVYRQKHDGERRYRSHYNRDSHAFGRY